MSGRNYTRLSQDPCGPFQCGFRAKPGVQRNRSRMYTSFSRCQAHAVVFNASADEDVIVYRNHAV